MNTSDKALVLAVAAILLASPLAAEVGREAVLGVWLVPKEDAQVTIYKCGEKYCGRITWMKSPEDLDTENPDPAKRSNKVLGMNILWGFTFDDGKWTGGRIYDPESGKTYKCRMWLKGADSLNIRGFVGITLLGRTETWTRVK